MPDALISAPLPATSEWLLADGAGGYACGTAADLPTRRYHGLWVARPTGSARRVMVVAGVHERVLVPGVAVGAEPSLLHAHWATLPEPSPPAAPVQFTARPLPTFRWHDAAFAFERTVALQRAAPGQPPCLLLRWRNLAKAPLRLAVRPLLGLADADHLPPAHEGFDAAVVVQGASWGLRPRADGPALWFTADGVAAYRAEPTWYRGFLYALDRDRGYDHLGDRWSPGVLELDLGPGQDAVLAVSLAEPCAAPAVAFAAAEAAAVARDAAAADLQPPLRARLGRTAADFLYRADGGRLGILAGFPWFGEWGRDVFVALPGLCFARGELALGLEVLLGALPFLRGGLLPNIYGRGVADSHYGSCDAALWFALAVQRYADAGGDPQVVRERLVPALRSIADAYFASAELGMSVDGSGLLLAGRDDLNATWMDARTAQGPVTPRAGQPVEIQALWYALLDFLAEHGDERSRTARDRCGEAFVSRFWLPDGQYLADRLHQGRADPVVRPNMVIAAALPRSPLSAAQRRSVVERAKAELLTPRGLRTLSPRDPAYRGRYQGGVDERDLAYHQGTVWPWLGGFYVEAALRSAPKARRAKVAVELRGWLAGFLPECDRAGIDHISEVFDGELPQRPGGTFAQAWNSGELLRALQLCDDELRP